MELSSSWDTVLETAGGLVVGLLLYFVALPLLLTVVHRWRHNRHIPAKGTRPEVLLIHDGVTYDLTEQLLRIKDNKRGQAVWVICGPQHLKLREDLNIQVGRPAPRNTGLKVDIKSEQGDDFGRFATLQELKQLYPELD
jgi:hypothetical protein